MVSGRNEDVEAVRLRVLHPLKERREVRHLSGSAHGDLIGHGAAGALEAVATVTALQQQFAPPTMNYEAADPDCDLDYVSNAARDLAIDAALSNSFAFGGLNAVLAFRRFCA